MLYMCHAYESVKQLVVTNARQANGELTCSFSGRKQNGGMVKESCATGNIYRLVSPFIFTHMKCSLVCLTCIHFQDLSLENIS